MQNHYNRNNESLAYIPKAILCGLQNLDDLTVWSWHTWIRDNRFLPAYHITIQYSFPLDTGKRMRRATVRNIWKSSKRIEIFCHGVQLEGNELKTAKLEIVSRLKLSLGYKSLLHKPITRYRFNIVAALPGVNLQDWDSHHDSMNNIMLRNFAVDNNIQIDDEWFFATDDRFDNVSSVQRFEHKLIHFANGDGNFFPYLNSESSISNANEMFTEGGDIEEINIVNEKCNNEGGCWVLGFDTWQQYREILKLYYELEFHIYPFGNLSIPVLQT